MNLLSYLSESESDTVAIGTALGELLEGNCLIFLEGTLGAGKTRFVQALAAGVGIEPQTVTSPTFTIMTPHIGRLLLVHVDAYRINDPDEAEQLGLDDWLAEGCVMTVEWSHRIANVLPAPDLTIEIEHCGQFARSFRFISNSKIGERLLESLSQRINGLN